MTPTLATPLAVAGDWHGDSEWIHLCLRNLDPDIRTIVQLGDFGLMGARFPNLLHKIDRVCEARDLTVFVVPGNHENHDWIERQPVDDDGLIVAGKRIRLFPRGWRFRIDDVTFCAVGGAVSVDQGNRMHGRSWWPQEEITEADVERIIAAGPADVLLLHDAPLGADPPALPHRELIEWAGARIVSLAYLHQERVRAIADALRPRRVLHAHFHARYSRSVDWTGIDGNRYRCLVDGLACEHMAGNLVRLDVDGSNMTVTDLDPRARK